MSLNRVQLIGRLGKDPETKHLDGGKTVSNFSVATSETWKDKQTGEKRENTEWHNIVCWNELAEIASKYLKKGQQVYIEGKIRTRSWEKDGVTRYVTEVFMEKLVMLGGAPQGQASQKPKAQQQEEPDVTGSDDLPF